MEEKEVMSRYIDADALIAKMPTVMDMQDTYLPIHFKEWLIDTAPSIDIVRCQDCKHWVYNFNGCARNPCTEPWYATDFCNYGERNNE